LKPDPSTAEPTRIGDSLDRVARRLGAPGARSLGAVFGHWTDIVGASVAAHARPVSLRDQVLRVEVDEPGWATQLRYLAPDILRRCEEVAGPDVVASVEVKVARYSPLVHW
jgi:predicted nucleic acid-binding Zn ribbon protein